MIRIFKLAAAYAAIGLLYARYRLNLNELGPATFQELNSIDMPEERCAQLLKVIEFIDGEGRRGAVIPTVDNILNTLLLALTSNPPLDESIIDRMGAFLKHPFGLNLIGDKMLKQLRRALLSSAEFEVLQEMMSRMEHRCACGHMFTSGEGAYFAGIGGAVQLMCFRCSLPIYSSCMSCSDGHVSMGQNIRNAMTSPKQVCPECKERKAAEMRAAAPPAHDNLQNHLQDRPGRPPRAEAVDPGIILREHLRGLNNDLGALGDRAMDFEVWQPIAEEPLLGHGGDRG